MNNLQGKEWQTQNPEHNHPVLVKFMAKFLQKYSTPYFERVLVAWNKTTKELPQYMGKFTWQEVHAQASNFGKMQISKLLVLSCTGKELDWQYAANLFTFIALGMDYILTHGAADIQIPDPVRIKRKMDKWQQNSVDARRRHGEARHIIGALQRGVSKNMDKFTPQKEVMWEKHGSE